MYLCMILDSERTKRTYCFYNGLKILGCNNFLYERSPPTFTCVLIFIVANYIQIYLTHLRFFPVVLLSVRKNYGRIARN